MKIYLVRQIFPNQEDTGMIAKDEASLKGMIGDGERHQVEPNVWWVFHPYDDSKGKYAIVWRVQEMQVY